MIRILDNHVIDKHTLTVNPDYVKRCKVDVRWPRTGALAMLNTSGTKNGGNDVKSSWNSQTPGSNWAVPQRICISDISYFVSLDVYNLRWMSECLNVMANLLHVKRFEKRWQDEMSEACGQPICTSTFPSAESDPVNSGHSTGRRGVLQRGLWVLCKM